MQYMMAEIEPNAQYEVKIGDIYRAVKQNGFRVKMEATVERITPQDSRMWIKRTLEKPADQEATKNHGQF